MMTNILQMYEDKFLESIVKNLISMGFVVSVFMYDGCMIANSDTIKHENWYLLKTMYWTIVSFRLNCHSNQLPNETNKSVNIPDINITELVLETASGNETVSFKLLEQAVYYHLKLQTRTIIVS